MNTYQKALDVVFEAIDEYNRFQQPSKQLDKSADTVLFHRYGFTESGVLDSLGLINFLVIVESGISQKIRLGFNLNIAALLENKESELKNIHSLVTAIVKILEK